MYTSSWNNRTRADKKGSTLRRLARRTSSNSVRAEHRYKDGDRRNGGNQNSAGVADGQGCVCFEGRARGADRSLSSWSARANVARRSRRQLERPWTTTTPSTQHTTSAHDFVRARAREREREAKEKSANNIQENTPGSTSLPQCARAKENRTAHPGAAIEIGQSRYPKTSLLCRRMFSLGSRAS